MLNLGLLYSICRFLVILNSSHNVPQRDTPIAEDYSDISIEPGEVKYDFAALATTVETDGLEEPAIFTFGGDRETFNFFDPFNYLNMDNDVWRFAPPPKGCPADFNGDGLVDGFDVTVLLGAWGTAPPTPEAVDLNGDQLVDGTDLAILIAAWGPCS